METLSSILDVFFSFKPYVMLPILMLAIALIVRMKLSSALSSTLKLAVGFAGIFIVFAFFVDNIQPAVKAIMTVRGLDFPVLDVGWPPLAAITWSSSIAPISIPLIIIINVVMIATNTTRTIYIDLWNFWHLALMGAFVLNVTENFFLGISAVVIITIYTIKMADWAAPHVETQSDLQGITISPISVVGLLPFSVTMDYIYDRIPGFKNLNFNPEKGNSRIGLFSEPMVIGIIIGILLGIASGYSIKLIMELSVHLAAVMFLLPKCGGLIGEGIEPISQALKKWIEKRFPGKDKLYVAVNPEVLMNNKSVMISGLILMPIALLIALILPGNKVLPLGDLPNLISIISVTVLVSRGNVIRSITTGIPIVVTFLLISTKLGDLITRLSTEAGMSFGEGQAITAFTDGGNHFRFFLLKIYEGNWIAIGIIPVTAGMMYLSYRKAESLKVSVK